MKFILLTGNWLQKMEIIFLNELKYLFSGGWTTKSSFSLIIKKVLKEVPFSRLNSSSNLSLVWSINRIQIKFSVIWNFDNSLFPKIEFIFISIIVTIYFLIVISDLSFYGYSHFYFSMNFQRSTRALNCCEILFYLSIIPTKELIMSHRLKVFQLSILKLDCLTKY